MCQKYWEEEDRSSEGREIEEAGGRRVKKEEERSDWG